VLDTPQTTTPSIVTVFTLHDHFRFDACAKALIWVEERSGQ